MSDFEPTPNERIWQVVATIPAGKVSTYGDVAAKAGMARAARRVGNALRGLPKSSRLPWHRVVNASGRISLPPGAASAAEQRQRLEEEGIVFRINESIDLKRFGWQRED